MRRSIVLLALAACAADEPSPTVAAHAGIAHDTFEVPVDGGHVVVHRMVRAHTRPKEAIVLLHGDFANFASSFTPMATWLAEKGIDVWGIDRRWTQQPRVAPDLSGFDAMGLDQELDDTEAALAFVREKRHDRVKLAGFSRGGQLAYFYASREATKPAWQRHVDGLVALDVYASLAPSDTALRQYYCDTAAAEYAELAAGNVDVYNVFQLTVGMHYLADPDAPSPWDEALTARDMMLWLVGQTYQFFPASEHYHLNGPTLDADGNPTGLRLSSETAVATWLANGSWHQAMRGLSDVSLLGGITADGRAIATAEFGDVDIARGIYLRATDASTAHRLGSGLVFDLDATRGVLASRAAPDALTIAPLDRAPPRALSLPDLADPRRARWCEGGVIVAASRGGRPHRLWRVDDHGVTALTDEGIAPLFVVHGREAAFVDGDRLHAGPRVVPGSFADEVVCGWPNAREVEVRSYRTPIRVRRVDIATGAATPILEVAPPPLGLRGVNVFALAGDAYAYSYAQELSRLYTMTVEDL